MQWLCRVRGSKGPQPSKARLGTQRYSQPIMMSTGLTINVTALPS